MTKVVFLSYFYKKRRMEELQEDKRRYTVEEYFELLEHSEEKIEYHNGEIFMMAGGTRKHNIIAANITRRLLEGLDKSDCVGYGSDMKVNIARYQSYVFPDLSVVCDPTDSSNDSADNPVLILEVLSPSTEGYDRGLKFRMYRSLPTLREYVLVSQEEPLVEVFYKQDDKSWHYQLYQGTDAEVTLSSAGHTISLKDIYQKVSFEGDTPPINRLPSSQ